MILWPSLEEPKGTHLFKKKLIFIVGTMGHKIPIEINFNTIDFHDDTKDFHALIIVK